MLDNLIQLVKDNAGETIINNSAIPNEQNDLACKTAAGSIFDSLKSMASGGDLSSITSMFSGSQGATTEQVNQISENTKNSLMNKLNIDSSTAGGIVSSLIPSVLSSLTSKTNDPNDNSFSLEGIIGSLTGGASAGGSNAVGGILGMIKNLFGGRK